MVVKLVFPRENEEDDTEKEQEEEDDEEHMLKRSIFAIFTCLL